jgi:hypothetical protein
MPRTKSKFDLRSSAEFYAQKYKYPQDQLERGLEAYAVHLFAQEEGFDTVLEGESTTQADLSAYICRSNDLQVDGVLEDEVGKRLLLVQAAWRNKDLEEEKVESFFDAPSRLLSGEYLDTGGSQVRELLSNFKQKIDDGYEISLRFVTNLPVVGKSKLEHALEAKNLQYEALGLPVSCELYGNSELAKRDEELQGAINGGLVDAVTIKLGTGKFLEIDAPFRTLVAIIKANELVDLYKRKGVGNSLFNLNIRLPLASRKVNPRIAETAASESESPNFFYYNNGVSAVCSEYRLEGNTLTAKRLQVINGAQTVSALVRALSRKPNSSAYVLFRLTETSEKYGGVFTENVIRYNNTQNPVKVSDFFSNDPIQIWLRDNLTRVAGRGAIPNVYYINKSGHKPRGATGKGLKIEQLAGIRHAFLYGPIASYKEPSQFFDRDAKYLEAFGVDGKAVDAWPEEDLYRCGAAIAVHEKVQGVGRTLKSNAVTKDSDEAKYLYRLARYVTALVAVGLEVSKSETFLDYATLVASKSTFDKYVDPILTQARSLLRYEWKARTAGAAAGVQPEYNLARDDAAWTRLKDNMREESLADLVGKAPA